jgi:hypothetical protein
MPDDQIEHGVTEELEALVVIQPIGGLLVTPAGVAERLLEEGAILEAIAQDGFQLGVIGHAA